MGRLLLRAQTVIGWVLVGILAVSAWKYAQETFQDLAHAQAIVMGLQEKPFVYRALVPWVARLLVILGFRADSALSVVVTASAVGLFYGIQYLMPRFGAVRESLIAFAGVEIFMQVFSLNAKPYDLSTAMFFAFCLGSLARNDFRAFYGMYALGCLNRETMFLLTIFFAVWYLTRMDFRSWIVGLGLQGLIFASIRWMLQKLFEDNPGSAFLFNPMQLLRDYWHYPVWTLAMLAVLGLAGLLVARRWRQKPVFLRCAMIVMFPLLLVMHILFGWPFEIRVFAEVYPIAIALAAYEMGSADGSEAEKNVGDLLK